MDEGQNDVSDKRLMEQKWEREKGESGHIKPA